MVALAQIPFDFFEPETPGFDNFLVADNAEVVIRLRELPALLASRRPTTTAWVVWGGSATGKTHLLHAVTARATAEAVPTMLLRATDAFPDDPFIPARLLCVDDAARMNPAQQAWLFTAFNHVVQAGGATVVTGDAPPGQWPIRDDIRTRLGSGLTFELHPVPQDTLPDVLRRYAEQRGFNASKEVIAYLLTHSQRDLASLCRTLAGVDRWSLAAKRPLTVPLLRAYLAASALGEVI